MFICCNPYVIPIIGSVPFQIPLCHYAVHNSIRWGSLLVSWKLGAKVAGSVDQLAFCGHRIRRWEKLSACKYYYLRRKSVSWISDGIWLPEQHLSQDNFWFPECWPLHPGAGTQPFDGHVCGQVPRYRGAHVLRGMELETICIKSDAGVGCLQTDNS